tara:strand:- start:23494 stop:23985 length:492 start_codon:yes stop_codon:yes gene_type:complete
MNKKQSKQTIRNSKIKRLAENKYARYQYEILETLEAGIALLGSEVKSVREGKSNLKDGFCTIRDDELLLLNVHISHNQNSGQFFNHDPTRNRKLLVHKNEIKKLKEKTQKKGLTIIPLSIHLKGSWIKISIGIGKGKNIHDKRQSEKKKESNREIKQALRRIN